MFLKGVLRGFDPGTARGLGIPRIRRSRSPATRQRCAARPASCVVDPLAAAKIDPNDTRRMIRALEVAKQTGQPLSHRQVHFDRSLAPEQCNAFVVQWERATLHQRINDRASDMFRRGLVDEVAALRINPRNSLANRVPGRRISRAAEHGTENRSSTDQVTELVAAHTRQLARRQETWFRSFDELTPIDGKEVERPLKHESSGSTLLAAKWNRRHVPRTTMASCDTRSNGQVMLVHASADRTFSCPDREFQSCRKRWTPSQRINPAMSK